jgi:hypothetical protein
LERKVHIMKKLIATLLTISLLLGIALPIFVAPPIIEYAHQSHGTHGLGNVYQEFTGVPNPPPWDNPPGLEH